MLTNHLKTAADPTPETSYVSTTVLHQTTDNFQNCVPIMNQPTSQDLKSHFLLKAGSYPQLLAALQATRTSNPFYSRNTQHIALDNYVMSVSNSRTILMGSELSGNL